MHRKRDWTTESGLNDLLLGRAGGGAPPVSTRGATLPVGAQSMATRSEIERSSMVHEAAAAAGYSSIPLYVQSLRDDPERLDRLEWTAKFESELMRRLKSVGWDPSNVTAESTAAAFAAIGIPVSGWRGASERRMPTEFKAMSGSAPPSDPGAFVPLPPDARAEKTNMPGVSAADRAELQRVIGAGRDIPVDVQRLIESVLAEKEGREPGLGNQGGRGSLTMAPTPTRCGKHSQPRTGGLFSMCGILGSTEPGIDPAHVMFGLDQPLEVPFWERSDNPCYGIDPSYLLSFAGDPPDRGGEPIPKSYPVVDMWYGLWDGQMLPTPWYGLWDGVRAKLKEGDTLEDQYWEQVDVMKEARIQIRDAESELKELELAYHDSLTQLEEELGKSIGREFEQRNDELNAEYIGKALHIMREIQEWINIRNDANELRKLIWSLTVNAGMPTDDFGYPQLGACQSWIGQALMDCAFGPDANESSASLNCKSPVAQCGPGATECPNFCTCRSGNSSECGESSSYRGGQTTSVCSGASNVIGGGGTGAVAGGCDIPCCSWIAAGLTDKCVGIDCTSCRAGSGDNRSVCESNLGTDVFQRLGCGYTDPIRQNLGGQFSTLYTKPSQWKHVTSGAAGLLRARDRSR